MEVMMSKGTLIWNVKHNLLVDWDTPFNLAVRRTEGFFDPNACYGSDRLSICIFGAPGSGKTSALKHISLSQPKAICVDRDSLFVMYVAKMRGEKSYPGTVGAYSKERLDWESDHDALMELWHSPDFAGSLWSADYGTGYNAHDYNTVILAPDYESYCKYLYYRDHDPNVKRNHEPNKILSKKDLIKFSQSATDDLVQRYLNCDEALNFQTLVHSYQPSDWDFIPKWAKFLRDFEIR